MVLILGSRFGNQWRRRGAGAFVEPPTPGGRPVREIRILSERPGCVQRPMRIHQGLTADGDEIGAALAHDTVGKIR
jgi:hypothetical protein